MDEVPQVAEITSDLFELSSTQKTAEPIILPDPTIIFPITNHFNRPPNFIAPPNTPVKLPMQVNPRYITKIYSSPRRMPNRVRPYYIPERPRTKSENSDTFQETRNIVDSVNNSIMMDTCCDPISLDISGNLEKSSKIRNTILLKKSKSLEDVRKENLEGSTPSHEMEFVSSRIQKLKVQE